MKQRGFTLIELMVALVVLVVLATMAVPSFMDYMQKARVRGAVDQVTNVLARARQGAVKSNMPISILAKQKSGGAWCVGARQPAEPASQWAARPLTAASCDCSTAASVCKVEGEVLVADTATLGSNTPTVSINDFDFSYSPKLGGVSDNGAPGRVFLSNASSWLDVTSANGRYLVRVVVTPLGQSYACVPNDRPPFSGYRDC